MVDKNGNETELNELLKRVESLSESLSDEDKLSFVREALKILGEE